MGRRARMLLAVTLALGVVAGASGIATADHPDESSEISLRRHGNKGLRGDVKSPDKECRKNRDVFLFRRQSGPDPLIASTMTDDRGKYEFGPQTKGTYYTRAEETMVGPAYHVRECGDAQSKDVKIKKDQKGA